MFKVLLNTKLIKNIPEILETEKKNKEARVK